MTTGAAYVLAGGGTGGHLYPGLAVAAALCHAEPDAQVTFFTTTRALDRTLLERTAFTQFPQPVQPLTGRPWAWPGFLLAWRRSVAAATTYFRETQPRAVLGLGGYAAGPPVVAARKLGIRTAILNPDAKPGRANLYLARHADLVVLQWNVAARHFPTGTNCRTLGCPLRPEFTAADRAAGRRHFGLDPERPLLVVTGASQGAQSVNLTMYGVWPPFAAAHPEWQLLHLTGPDNAAAARSAYGCGEAGVAAGGAVHVVGFTHEMWLALAAADVVVSRAGAGTLAELTVLGKPAVLLPYPYHRDRHQHANAQVLVDAGAALLIDDGRTAAANSAPLRAALEHLAHPDNRARMAQAALRLGRSDAAQQVAAWLRHEAATPPQTERPTAWAGRSA